jgi:hypothetical protein
MKTVAPTVARDGRVLIPSPWSVLAYATLEHSDSPPAAQELARAVLETAELAVPRPLPEPELTGERIS